MESTVSDGERVATVVPSLPKVAPYLMLDAWRGVAALWVVTVHCCLPYVLNGHGSLLSNPVYLVSIQGQLGVALFFVISGYCITGAAYNSIRTRKSVARFCLDRFRRIYPPYLVAFLFTTLLLAATDALQRLHVFPPFQSVHDPLPTGAVFWLSNLTLTQALAGQPSLLLVAWSLCFEVAFYGVVVVLLGVGWSLQKDREEPRVAVLAIGTGSLTCASLVWLCRSPATCPFPFQLWYQFGLGALIFLCFAADASRPEQGNRRLKIGVRIALAAAFALTTLYAVVQPDAPMVVGAPSIRLQVVVTMVFCALLWVLHPHDARLVKSQGAAALLRLGEISYSLYLIHLPVLPFVDGALRRMDFTGPWYLVTYGAQLVVAIAAGWAFFQVVERRFISGRQVRRLAAE